MTQFFPASVGITIFINFCEIEAKLRESIFELDFSEPC